MFDYINYSAYLCNNNKRKESYMETKDKKIQVHTIDYKDIDKFSLLIARLQCLHFRKDT